MYFSAMKNRIDIARRSSTRGRQIYTHGCRTLIGH